MLYNQDEHTLDTHRKVLVAQKLPHLQHAPISLGDDMPDVCVLPSIWSDGDAQVLVVRHPGDLCLPMLSAHAVKVLASKPFAQE